jgi:hypothetical protein
VKRADIIPRERSACDRTGHGWRPKLAMTADADRTSRKEKADCGPNRSRVIETRVRCATLEMPMAPDHGVLPPPVPISLCITLTEGSEHDFAEALSLAISYWRGKHLHKADLSGNPGGPQHRRHALITRATYSGRIVRLFARSRTMARVISVGPM